MRISLMLPSVGPGGVLDRDGLETVVRAAEDAGLDACSVTDHPLPMTREPRHTGLDPFTALGWIAQATERLRLHTAVVVLPYRNPFLVAQAAATVDYLSGGRMILGLGSGYSEPEFAALGVELGRRRELMDEGVAALKAAWTGEPVHMATPRWRAAGNVLYPQNCGPPVWLGGNGRAARRRAARLADGWSPFETPGTLAGGHGISNLAELAEAIADCRRREAEHDRERPLELSYVRPLPGWLEAPEAAVQQELADIAGVGVGWLVLSLGEDGADQLVERIGWFAGLRLPGAGSPARTPPPSRGAAGSGPR
jgi:probable F420-dependent oxidoreductase